MTQFQNVPRFDEMLAIEAASETRADFICKTCMHLAGRVLVLIVAGLATGLNLGIFFTIAMIILACGHILIRYFQHDAPLSHRPARGVPSWRCGSGTCCES